MFFFCLFITYVRPMRSWRGYVQSVSCPLCAQWRLVASTPTPSAQAYPKKMWFTPRRFTKERRASMKDKRKKEGKSTKYLPTSKPFLRIP